MVQPHSGQLNFYEKTIQGTTKLDGCSLSLAKVVLTLSLNSFQGFYIATAEDDCGDIQLRQRQGQS